MKSLSCGIVVLNGDDVLLCHATGQSHWDIPKGHIEDGELPIDAAIRECAEETGFVVKPDHLIDLGRFSYNVHKDLYLFGYTGQRKFPVVDDCECTSHFIHPLDKKCLPEVDDYKWVHVSELERYVTRNMHNTLDEALYKMGIKPWKLKPSR